MVLKERVGVAYKGFSIVPVFEPGRSFGIVTWRVFSGWWDELRASWLSSD